MEADFTLFARLFAKLQSILKYLFFTILYFLHFQKLCKIANRVKNGLKSRSVNWKRHFYFAKSFAKLCKLCTHYVLLVILCFICKNLLY